MDRWPEDIIAIWCGYFPVVTDSKLVHCAGCGADVFVSPTTIPTLDKFLKVHPEVRGYDYCCKQCQQRLFDDVEKRVIPNPNLTRRELN